MTIETDRNPAHGRTSVLKWSGILLVVIAGLLLVLYAATPWLVARLAPYFAEGLGLHTIELAIAYPKIRGTRIERLTLASDEFVIRGENARIEYSWSELRNGVIDSLAFDSLEISLYAEKSQATTQEPPTVDQIFPTVPFRLMRAERLVLKMPDTGFVGIGTASLGDGALSFAMDGIEPEKASRFSVIAALSRDGVFSARFSERDNSDTEFMTLDGALLGDTMSIEGDVKLSGYALQLTSMLAGLPTGMGTVAGQIQTHLPWPLPEKYSWQEVVATLPEVAVDWKATDNNLELNAIAGTVKLDRGNVAATLAGTIRYRNDARQITATLPANYPLHYHEGTLTGAAGLRVNIKEPKTEAKAVFRSFTLRTVTETALDIDADVDGRLDNIRARGRLKGRLTPKDPKLTDGNGRLDFTGSVQAGDHHHRGNLNGIVEIAGDNLNANGTVTSGILNKVPFALDYDLESRAGRFRATNTFEFRQPVAAMLLPDWKEVYDLDAGRVVASLELNWQTPDTVATDLVLTISDGRAHYDDYLASGLAGRLNFRANDSSNKNDWRLNPTNLQIELADVGIPIEDLVMGFSWSGDRVDVTEAGGRLLGGNATATPFAYDIPTGNASFELNLEDIDLGTVLALEGDDIIGTGTLKGILPVVINNNRVLIDGGSIAADAPGGDIRLTPQFSGPSGQPGLDFALLALKDFIYSSLTAEIDYAENGDLGLAVRLQGRNPAVEQGRPIHYNLNITENVPVLLESLRIQDKVIERIEQEAKK